MPYAPPGAVVRIFYDPSPGDCVAAGHFLVTKTLRTYRVVSARVQQRGRHAGRLHLACVVCGARGGPLVRDYAAGRIHVLVWYPRTRRCPLPEG